MSLIYEALANVMQDVDHVAKRDRNDHQKFNFRGIDAVVNAVGPVLRKHRVIVYPEVETVTYDDVQTSTGKPATACRVVATYTFAASDGSTVSTCVIGEAWDSGDKAAPKAMSVAFRTALLQALALPTDEPDPDSHSYERSKVDLAPLHALIAEAKAAGLQGDYDATLEWAAQAQSYADKACDKLRTAIANHKPQDSSAGGDGTDAALHGEVSGTPAPEPPAGDHPADGSSRSVGSARDETSSSSAAPSGEGAVPPGGSPSTAASSPDLSPAEKAKLRQTFMAVCSNVGLDYTRDVRDYLDAQYGATWSQMDAGQQQRLVARLTPSDAKERTAAQQAFKDAVVEWRASVEGVTA